VPKNVIDASEGSRNQIESLRRKLTMIGDGHIRIWARHVLWCCVLSSQVEFWAHVCDVEYPSPLNGHQALPRNGVQCKTFKMSFSGFLLEMRRSLEKFGIQLEPIKRAIEAD